MQKKPYTFLLIDNMRLLSTVCRCRGQQPHVFRSKFGHNNKPLLPAAWTNYLRERSRTYDLQGMSSSLVKANFEGKTLLAS